MSDTRRDMLTKLGAVVLAPAFPILDPTFDRDAFIDRLENCTVIATLLEYAGTNQAWVEFEMRVLGSGPVLVYWERKIRPEEAQCHKIMVMRKDGQWIV